MLRQAARDFQAYTADVLAPPDCRGTRDVVALFSIFGGGVRILNSLGVAPRSALPVSILPSDLYGLLLVLAGIGLLLTGSDCLRANWRGQAIAACAGGLWLLLSLDVLAGSLASGINAFIIAALAVNEVRVHGC